jgi:3-oxoacyl-[acyl-carrier protein] reductase
VVPVRSHAPEKLIHDFSGWLTDPSGLGSADMSPLFKAETFCALQNRNAVDNNSVEHEHGLFAFGKRTEFVNNERTKMENGKLNGKVAVVTGASKGIGAGIAKEFAAEGASVIVNYASAKHDADRVVDEISKGGGNAIAIQGNVAKKADVERLFAGAENAFGKVDILVNNAGVYEFMPLEQVTEQQFHRMFDINVLGMLFATQEALKHFNDGGGSIVNISSIASSFTPPTGVVYNATKAAVDAITRTLAKELGARKIRVNSINPGMVVTEGLLAGGLVEGDFRKMVESQTPLGRIGKPEDIARAAVFFASSDSGWITGETLVIAGGFR